MRWVQTVRPLAFDKKHLKCTGDVKSPNLRVHGVCSYKNEVANSIVMFKYHLGIYVLCFHKKELKFFPDIYQESREVFWH